MFGRVPLTVAALNANGTVPRYPLVVVRVLLHKNSFIYVVVNHGARISAEMGDGVVISLSSVEDGTVGPRCLAQRGYVKCLSLT